MMAIPIQFKFRNSNSGAELTPALDDVILRNVGILLGDVIPLNLTDRLYIKKYQREAVREGWREGGNPSEPG